MPVLTDQQMWLEGGVDLSLKYKVSSRRKELGCISRDQTPVKPSDWVILRDVYKVCFSYKNESDASEELPLFCLDKHFLPTSLEALSDRVSLLEKKRWALAFFFFF